MSEGKDSQNQEKPVRTLSRRAFLKLGAGAAAGVAAETIDQVLNKGRFTTAAIKYVTNPAYRDKANMVIQQGKAGEKVQEMLQQSAKEFTGTPDTVYDLGKETGFEEPWLDLSFKKYKTIELNTKGEPTGRNIIIADLGNVFPAQSVQMPVDADHPNSLVSDFTSTQKKYGGFATLPGQQYDMIFHEGSGSYTAEPMTYCEYLGDNGKVKVYYDKLDKKDKGIDNSVNPRAGAIVVKKDGTLQIVDTEEANKIHVNGNIVAKETIIYSVSSNTLQNDIKEIDEGNSYIQTPLTEQTLFNSLLVSFITQNGEVENKIVGIYNPPNSMNWMGNDDRDVLSIRQIAHISQQLVEQSNGQLKAFTIAVTDTKYQSRIDSPIKIDSNKVYTDPNIKAQTDLHVTKDFNEDYYLGEGRYPFNPVKRPDYYLVTKSN